MGLRLGLLWDCHRHSAFGDRNRLQHFLDRQPARHACRAGCRVQNLVVIFIYSEIKFV
jgi:hypothetical protein